MVDVDCLLNSKFYAHDTEDYDDVLSEYVNQDAEFKKSLNRRILSVSLDISASIQQSYAVTLEKLFVTTKAQRPVPGKLFKE